MQSTAIDDRLGSETRGVATEPAGSSAWSGIGASVITASVGLNILSLVLPVLVLQIYDRVLPNGAVYTLFWFAVGFVVVTVLEAVLRWSRGYLIGWSGVRRHHAMLVDATRHLLGADLWHFEQRSSGEHINSLQAIDQFADFIGGESRLVIIDLIFIPLFLVVFWSIAGSLVAIPVCLLAAAMIAAFIISRLIHRGYVERAATDDRRSSFIIEVLKGLETVKLLGMEPFMMRRYERLRARTAANAYRLIFLGNLAQQMGGIVSAVTMAFVAVFGAKLVIEQQISIGGLAACMMLASRIVQPPLRGFSLLSQFQVVSFARQRLNEILTIPTARIDQGSASGRLTGAIDFRDVSFSFVGCDEALLNKINLSVSPGEYIAIRGESGVGKTTLLMLTRGLLYPKKGQILIDGRNIDDWELSSLRDDVMLIGQQHVLFRGTILDNLTMFQHSTTVEDGLNAARAIGLDGSISLLPEGYDTEIRDASDIGLSDGLRQGVAVARAFARDYRIILFDEANSCLDTRVNQGVVEAFRRNKGRATLVLVTRNPSLLALSDRIYEIRDRTLHFVAHTAGREIGTGGADEDRRSHPTGLSLLAPKDAVSKGAK